MARVIFGIAVAALATTLLISGCSKGRTFVVHGMDDGYKRDWGGGFYGVDRAQKAPPGHWESIIWSRDLYYRTRKIDESDYAEISPSGRYAVYHSELYGGILLFDSQSGQMYRVGKGIGGPYDAKWRFGERAFTMTYYPVDPNHSETADVNIASLRPSGTLDSPPPHLR
jgi:hypothetical protein